MSDHVDGPRSIGDPAADLSDLFAFTSPADAARTVLAACVFPSAGEDAMFSNVIDYSIVARRVSVAGVGAEAKFQPADDEIRFSFRFNLLKRDAAGHAIQADHRSDRAVKDLVSTLFKTGLESLKSRFGVAA